MARPKVVHIKSNTLNKKPTTGQIDYGEIAVNYNSGNTFLAVKDSKNDIKVFTDKTTNDASYAPKSDFNELKQGVINNEQTTSAALNDLNTRVNQLSSVDMGNYATTATTEAIKSDISGLKTSVGANETKISALEANLSSYVPTSRTINGTALTSNITITKVESATTSTNVNGHTVAKSVPSDAVFTDTTYDDVTTSTHGLMTAADKTKLDGIASGATKYSHPTFTAKASEFYKIAVNNEGHVTGTTNVAKSDITGLIGGTPSLEGHTHDDRYYTETEVNTKLATISSKIPTKYAGSSSTGGPASSAKGVIDYNSDSQIIAIGYAGYSLNANQISFIAAYNDNKKIKNANASAVISYLSAVTQTELNSKGYVTSTELNNKGYATQDELSSSLTGYVPTGRTVNGKILSQNITIDSVASATTSKSATTASSASSVAWSNVKNAPSFASSDHTHSEYVKKTGDTMSGTFHINSTSTALTCTGKTEFRGTMNISTSDSYDENVILSVDGRTLVYGLGIKGGGLEVTGATSLSGNTSIEGDVTVTGKVSASNGFFQTSDRRLKNFQGDIEVDFDKLKSIPKKYFYWNMDSKKSKLEIGTSAQEVMEVYPELVSINEAGMLSVAYDKLSVIALKAVDELHEENVALKEKNDELERRLKAIEEKLGI